MERCGAEDHRAVLVSASVLDDPPWRLTAGSCDAIHTDLPYGLRSASFADALPTQTLHSTLKLAATVLRPDGRAAVWLQRSDGAGALTADAVAAIAAAHGFEIETVCARSNEGSFVFQSDRSMSCLMFDHVIDRMFDQAVAEQRKHGISRALFVFCRCRSSTVDESTSTRDLGQQVDRAVRAGGAELSREVDESEAAHRLAWAWHVRLRRGESYARSSASPGFDIWRAAWLGDAPAVAAGLENRVSVESEEPFGRQNSPLRAAAGFGRLEVIRLLLDAAAAVDAQGSDGETALTRAAAHGHDECARMLLAAGADVRVAGDWKSVLHAAASHGHMGTLKLLCEAPHADEAFGMRDGWGWTPIEAAARWGHTMCITVLWEAAVALSAQTAESCAVLAVQFGHETALATIIHHAKAANIDLTGNAAVVAEAKRWARQGLMGNEVR